ncbi:hypothetical protein RP20_CCG007376 [Aedes albopictus]|nr:fibrinogen-like protein A [Aedes albopictus]KXJ77518.1 hypothetical protein RP20_CCG007376 [Aedes albopictus]
MAHKQLQLFIAITLRRRLILDCPRMKVIILIIICVFCAIRYHEATKVSNVCSNCPANLCGGFGYEILIAKLEALEVKLDERCNTHKEMMLMQTRLERAVVHHLRTALHHFASILQQHPSCGSFACKSCSEVPSHVSGRYKIHPLGFDEPLEVYCEQKVFDGGWIVVQQRLDGSVNFHRNWTDYQNGFGNLGGEFWIGLEKLHRLTKGGGQQLLVELKDFNGSYKFARYDEFEIGAECQKYELKKLGRYNGTAGDALRYHEGRKFSTEDNYSDDASRRCAQLFKSAWWYKECYYSDLNGL